MKRLLANRFHAIRLFALLLVLIPVEYVDHFRNARGIEVLGDNGKTAILGWQP